MITHIEIKVLKTKTVKYIEIKRAITAFTIMAIYLSFTAITQVIWEKLTFTDALYASFIAYSTVGFGDYVLFESVTGQGKNEATAAIFPVLATFPALFGLAVVACVLNSLLEVVDKNRLHISDGLCCCRSRRRGRRKSKESVKHCLIQMDAGGSLTHRRSHSV